MSYGPNIADLSRRAAVNRRMGGAQRYPSIAVDGNDWYRCAPPILRSEVIAAPYRHGQFADSSLLGTSSTI
jgi:hypothetical protein